MEETLDANEKKNDLTLIVNTAIRTAFIMFIVLSLAICVFFSFFPALPQQLYYSMDNTAQALRYSRIRAEGLKNDGDSEKYCYALLDVVTLTEKLYYEKGDAYADLLYKTTLELMNEPSFEEFNNKIDEYNYLHSSSSYRAVVYSNESYLRKLNFLGALDSKKEVKFCINDGLETLDEILARKFDNTFGCALKYSYLFIQLSELLKLDYEIVLPTELSETFSEFKDYALNFEGEETLMDDAALAKLYLVRAAGMFSHKAAEKFDNEWNTLNSVGPEKIELIEYYKNELLKDYITTTKN